MSIVQYLIHKTLYKTTLPLLYKLIIFIKKKYMFFINKLKIILIIFVTLLDLKI